VIINQHIFEQDIIFNLQTSGVDGSAYLIDTVGNTAITNTGGAVLATIIGVNAVRVNNAYLSVTPTDPFNFGTSKLSGVTFDVEWIANTSRPASQTTFFGSATDTGSMNGFFFGYDELNHLLYVYERERFVVSYSFIAQPLVVKKISICIYINSGFPSRCDMFVDGIFVATGDFISQYGQNSIDATDKVTILSSIYNSNNDYFKSFTITKGVKYGRS
jgi:hypothetical protein